MTARDGARLVADLYLPDDDAPHPVLLHRTAYGRQTTAMVADLVADPAELAAHGYAVVVQDVRGRYASEGEWSPFVHEREDGYDAVEWAAEQPWSTGRVGVYGSSYMGITAYQAVLADPPHLAAAASVVSGCDVNDGLARTGGVLELGFLSLWALSTAADAIGRIDDPQRRADLTAVATAAAADPWAVVRTTPVLDAAPAQVCDWLADWLHREPTDPSWDAVRVTGADVRVPLLQVVGFRDWMQRSMVRLFRELPVDDRSALIAGPWTHRSAYGGDSGLRDWSAAAPGGPAGHTPRLLAWFDRHLAGRDATEIPRVSWFATGEETWRAAATWPPAGHETAFTLAAGGALVPSSDAVDDDGWDTWRHDPADPVPSVGGMTAMPLFAPDGVQDRSSVAARADVVVHTAAPQEAPLRIAGDVRLEVTVAASAEDADLVVVLVDVTPEGAAEPITEGVQRLRYRNGRSDDLLVPGQPVDVVVHLADTAHTLLPGHRLRVEVAASNFPRWSLNPGGADLPELEPAGRPVELRIAHGARLVLHCPD